MYDQERYESLEARRLTYVFLARAYREELPLSFIEALRDAPPSFDSALGEFLVHLPMRDMEEVRRDMAADYAALFLGMSVDPVSPYESVYTSTEQLLMQKSRDEVLVCYREEGLDKRAAFTLPEDHIALELEFAALLCEREQAGLQQGDPERADLYATKLADFVECHLANWVPAFVADVKRQACTDFYRGLAETTESFIEMEHRLSR